MSVFSKVVAWLRGEPALVTSVLGTGAALGASFGVNFTPDQMKAAYGALSLVIAVVIRSRVTPTSVAVAVPEGAAQPPTPVVLDGVVMGHAGLPPTSDAG